MNNAMQLVTMSISFYSMKDLVNINIFMVVSPSIITTAVILN